MKLRLSEVVAAAALVVGIAGVLNMVLPDQPAYEGLPHRKKHELFSIQGEYSHLGCPGQRTETIEVDGHVFFLTCFGSTEEPK